MDMHVPDTRCEYWRKNLRLTGSLLVVWFVVTFCIAWFARDLAAFTFLDFPVPFYVGAQGALFVYVLIIWIYARRMNRLDEEYDVAEEER
jgi:putative solute:sodium symporter small subunit